MRNDHGAAKIANLGQWVTAVQARGILAQED